VGDVGKKLMVEAVSDFNELRLGKRNGREEEQASRLDTRRLLKKPAT